MTNTPPGEKFLFYQTLYIFILFLDTSKILTDFESLSPGVLRLFVEQEAFLPHPYQPYKAVSPETV